MNLAARITALRRIGAVTLGMTMALMVLGGWVKATGSGLACPDWPTCYGEWLPPFPSIENGGTWTQEQDGSTVTTPIVYTQAQVIYEWAHRAVASLLGIPILLFAGLSLFGRGLSLGLRILPTASVVVLALQFAIGRETVLQGNPALVTTLHLATATLFLVLVTFAVATSYLRPAPPAPPTPPPAPEAPPAPRFEGYTYTDSGESVDK